MCLIKFSYLWRFLQFKKRSFYVFSSSENIHDLLTCLNCPAKRHIDPGGASWRPAGGGGGGKEGGGAGGAKNYFSVKTSGCRWTLENLVKKLGQN